MFSSLQILSQRISRGQEEDAFDDQECRIDPTELASRLDADPMADPGNGRGCQGVTIELVVDIMNFDQKPVGVYLSG